MTARPSFDAGQRERLKDLGVFDEQAHCLEVIFPLCRALLSKPATMTEVRDKLSQIAKPLKQAKEAMDAVFRDSSHANMEANNRILLAETATQSTNDGIAEELTHIVTIVQRALESLAAEQRRAHYANPIPIRLIESALLKGFTRHHDPEMQGKGLPPYQLTVSRKRPPFPEIAAICYEAIGRCNEPDRAIRNYLTMTKHQRRRPNVKMVSRDQNTGEIVKIISDK